MKSLSLLVAALLTLAASAHADPTGVWGGKWDDKWPVFLVVKPGDGSDTYEVDYIWLENTDNEAFSRQHHTGDLRDGYVDAFVRFRVDGDRGLLYGPFRKPRMANLVRIGEEVPDVTTYQQVLDKYGWKPGVIPADEAWAKIQGKE